MTTTENWTKFVTLNPPNEVKFKFIDENSKNDPQSVSDSELQKATARIEIINKSKTAILFKVSANNQLTNHVM